MGRGGVLIRPNDLREPSCFQRDYHGFLLVTKAFAIATGFYAHVWR